MAIDVPEPVRDELEALQDALTVGRLVPSENLHITLSFLGEQSDDAIEDAHQALSGIRAAAFDLQLAEVGSFGKRSPQIICAEVAKSEDLIELEKRTTRGLRQAGVEFQKRRFRPHVTLARLPRRLSPYDLADIRDYLEESAAFRGSHFEVRSFELYRSTLTTRGALHEVLASYNLQDI